MLESRWLWVLVIGAALALSLPTLSNGLFLDDYQQRIALSAGDHANVFEFFHRGTATGEAQMQSGVLPWWTSPDTKVMFYRPLAQELTELDYRLWPDNIPLMHLHSVLWYVLTVLVACFTYRQTMPSRWGAGLAAVLFAVDGAHSAVGWLANRNVMPCMASALLSLLCYRRSGWRWQIAGPVLFYISLSCGESGLAITGYYVGHALFVSKEGWHVRALRLLPYALIALVWLSFWKVHGFGTSGPGFYIDPVAAPALFARELFYRFPAYLVGQLFLPTPELFSAVQDNAMRPFALGYALGVMVLLAWLFLPLLRRSREARFFCCGMLIAILPICSSIPVYRSLWFVGFGAAGLLSLFLEGFRSFTAPHWRMRVNTVFAVVMLAVHLGISPVLFLVYDKAYDVLDGWMDSRRVQLPNEGQPGGHVLALSVLSYVTNVTFPILKDQALSLGRAPTRTTPAIGKIRALAEGEGDYMLLRKDADVLVATRAAGFTTLRPRPYGFSPGEHVRLDDVDIFIRSVSPDRAPTVVEYDFHPRALQKYQVVAWSRDHFVSATLPEVGQRVRIESH